MRLGFSTSIVALAFVAAGPAAAQSTGVSAATIFGAFEDQGFELAEASSDGSRRAKLELAGEEPVNFVVRPIDCQGTTGCKAVIMFANFTLSNGVSDARRAAVMSYNDSVPYGRAYALSNAVGVDSVIRLDSPNDVRYLRNRIKDFGTIVPGFLKHMRDKAKSE